MKCNINIDYYCDLLRDRIQDPVKYKGFVPKTFVDKDTGRVSRKFVAYKSRGGEPGEILNYCPFCGEKI